MREIIKAELAATIPVIVYVSPEGARADSAGAFLVMAADVAAMAPQTNIGSSTPVNVGGANIESDLRRKIVNDAAAYIRELAEEHGRNGDVAEDFVREGTNIGAREALERERDRRDRGRPPDAPRGDRRHPHRAEGARRSTRPAPRSRRSR